MELKNFLIQCGFSNSYADASLFVYSHNNLLVYVLVYVDDILVPSNNNDVVSRVIAALGDRFSLKDQGDVNYFLGIEITQKKQRVTSYATEVHSRSSGQNQYTLRLSPLLCR